ncbi:hypothetical protein [Tenacibaculum aiptasiae]|uniref:hypothetical protein n=1 Tax=Tenacibaculum aiptasiae TaxID=426481 RepID=UPI00232C30E7|nr:hypothetical protein [Tenacibaculum aiptasiae]
MKKVVSLLVMFSIIMLTSCTDNSLEELEKKNEKQELQSTDPGNNGQIKDTDPDDDGEG